MTEKISQCLVLQGLGLNNRYQHTIWFNTESAQQLYFKSKVRSECTFTKLSYIRPWDGSVILPIREGKLYNCNYIMFRNASEKWYYAFITDTEYISDGATKVNFEIDYIQSWLFDWDFSDVLIEREHVKSDELWTHLAPESFPFSDSIFSNMRVIPGLSWQRYFIVYAGYTWDALKGEWIKATGSVVNGTFMGSDLYLCKTFDELSECVETLKNSSDEPIYTIQVVPAFLCDSLNRVESGSQKYLMLKQDSYVTNVKGLITFTHEKIDGYKPRNNKCFNYPYYSMYITNQQGVNDTYDFAFIDDPGAVDYHVYGDIAVNNMAVLSLNYKGSNSHDYDIPLMTMPQVQYNTDSYKNYEMSQQQIRINGTLAAVSNAESAVSGAVSGAVAGSAGGPVGAAAGAVKGVLPSLVSAFNNALSTYSQLDMLDKRYQISPPAVHNLVGSGDLAFKMNSEKPKIGIRCLPRHLVKMLDDFLTVYGYQVNRIGKPNRSYRKAFNYVKTNCCAIRGNLPASVESAICSIHDNGITYWKNGDSIGDYSVDNTL